MLISNASSFDDSSGCIRQRLYFQQVHGHIAGTRVLRRQRLQRHGSELFFRPAIERNNKKKNWRIARHPSVSTPRYILAVLSHGGKTAVQKPPRRALLAGAHACEPAQSAICAGWDRAAQPLRRARILSGTVPLSSENAVRKARSRRKQDAPSSRSPATSPLCTVVQLPVFRAAFVLMRDSSSGLLVQTR